jgi:hypothetical protein
MPQSNDYITSHFIPGGTTAQYPLSSFRVGNLTITTGSVEATVLRDPPIVSRPSNFGQPKATRVERVERTPTSKWVLAMLVALGMVLGFGLAHIAIPQEVVTKPINMNGD